MIPVNGAITCNTCFETKSEDEFYRHSPATKGWKPACKACVKAAAKKWAQENPAARVRINRRWRQKHPDKWRKLQLAKFGVSPEQYDEMLERQGGVCAICASACVTGWALCVDHCHTTGRVRGLLCHKCNSGIGQFGDSPALVKKALEYLNGF